MTDQQHPITPPPELVLQWVKQWQQPLRKPNDLYCHIATAATQWGSDQRGTINEAQLQERAYQELEACIEWVSFHHGSGQAERLRAARRPKPPSLKEQALADLTKVCEQGKLHSESLLINTIRSALEALND